MKNALKCVFELLDLVRNSEKETTFSEKGEYLKKCLNKPHSLSSNPCQSVRECPKILKICQITKLDMGFQKKNISSRSENIDFFESYRFLRQCLLKKIF